MIADLTLQTPMIMPSPLGVPVMFTCDILMLPEIFKYLVKCVLAIFNIGILWNLLIDLLVCHGN